MLSLSVDYTSASSIPLGTLVEHVLPDLIAELTILALLQPVSKVIQARLFIVVAFLLLGLSEFLLAVRSVCFDSSSVKEAAVEIL